MIGTNEGGIVDIITKDTGLLMERENYYDLALKVQAILHKQIVYDRDYIAEYTKKNYSQDIYIENLVSIYENALASKYQKLKKSNRS